MTNDKKSIIVTSSILGVLVLLLLFFAIFGLDLGMFKIASVKDLINQKQNVEKANADLKSQEAAYTTALKKVETAESSFDKEKSKYESISDNTIKIIKEATKEENYSMEYMWIKLGNYAKSNNLSLMVTDSSSKAGDTTGGSTTSGNTTPAAGNTATGTGTAAAQDANATTNTANNTANNTAANTPANDTTNNVANSSTSDSSGTVLKIQVSGSYIDVSDFIFEVENDKELRFRLDNISMEYVEGTTVKTTFDVKNLVIKK